MGLIRERKEVRAVAMSEREFLERMEPVKERLYRIAVSYMGDEQAGLEAVEETVYRAFRARSQLRQPEFFATWITRILIHECKRELTRRRREVPVEQLPEETLQALQPELDALPLRQAVERLPESLRRVVVLRYFGGYTLAETADALDIPQGTAVTWQRRALKLLRLELEEESV